MIQWSVPASRRLANRLGIFDLAGDDLRELPSLQQLASLAAAARGGILPETDRHLRAAAHLDAQQIAVARRGAEAQHRVLIRRQLDEDHSLAGTGKVVDLVYRREHGVRFSRRRDDNLLARH